MNYIPLCPKCSKLPMIIKLHEKNPNIINTQCDTKCNNEEEIDLTRCSSLSEEEILNAFQCMKHDSSFSFFCKECRTHLCKRCQEEHDKNHKVIEIGKEIVPTNVVSQIDNVRNYLNVELKRIKDEYIKQIEDSYIKCVRNNNAILNYLNTICSFYEMGFPNYHIKNLLDKYTFITNDTINRDNLIEFFNSYSVLKEEVSDEIKLLNSIKEMRTIQTNLSNINSVVLLKDGRIAVANDKMIKLYNSQNDTYELTIEDKNGTIYDLIQMDNGQLLTSSEHYSLKVWIKTGFSFRMRKKIEGAHSKKINKLLLLNDSTIASCSDDSNIKIWNDSFPSTKPLLILYNDDNEDITSIIQLKNSNIISASYVKKLLKVWNIEKKELIRVVDKIECWGKHSMIEVSNKLLIGGEKQLTILNLNNYQIENTLGSINGFIRSISSITDDTVLLGIGQKELILYRLNEKKYEKKTNQLVNNIVMVKKNTFITTSLNNTITIWNYS